MVAALLAATALLAPAAPAGASAARPLVSLSASPSRVALDGGGATRIEVTNVGTAVIAVAVSAEGLALDLRGRPSVARGRSARSAAPWLSVRPRSLVLRPGRTAALAVAVTLPRRAEPGDHHALLLLTSRPLARGGVSVRMRLGVRVLVRAPGTVVRRLVVRAVRVRRSAGARTLEVALENRGNVTEELVRGRIALLLVRRGRTFARLRPAPRELLPRSRGVASAVYRGRARGRVVVRVAIRNGASRSFHVRL
ncbi:MAG: hypothetical protein ACM33B_04975 [Pseudomonadota bacterium]